MSEIKYSQNEEQQYILAYFNGKQGRFLDVGAFDGITFSNTYALLLSGWSGVEVEASPAVFAGLQRNLTGKNVQLCHAVVTHEPVKGMITFHDEHGALGTTEQSNVDKWKNYTTFHDITMMPVHINAILGHFGTDFKMVNIDVEGQSAELFKIMYPQLPEVDLWVIEHDNKQDEIRELAQGFSVLYENGENIVLGRV